MDPSAHCRDDNPLIDEDHEANKDKGYAPYSLKVFDNTILFAEKNEFILLEREASSTKLIQKLAFDSSLLCQCSRSPYLYRDENADFQIIVLFT